MKKRVAFTLIEIVLVLALIGILLTMVMPNIEYFKTLEQNLEIREFKRDIMWARNKAIIEARLYEVKFYHEENYYTIRASTSLLIKKKYFKSGIRLGTHYEVQKVIFRPNGSVSNARSVNFFDRNDNKFILTITPVRGLIKIRPANP